MSWEQLRAIREEAAEIDKQEATSRPVSCPNDYTALVEGPGGTLHCPWDGWQYPRDA